MSGKVAHSRLTHDRCEAIGATQRRSILMPMPMRSQAFLRLSISATIGLAALVAPAGCKASSITVEGGTNLIVSRRVNVGDTFTVKQPFDPNTGAEWKLSAYDTTLVQPVARQPYETHTDGSMYRVFEFLATAPGRLELTFLRRNREPVTPGTAPPPPDTKTLRVKLVE
jgi:hypothetical protein